MIFFIDIHALTAAVKGRRRELAALRFHFGDKIRLLLLAARAQTLFATSNLAAPFLACARLKSHADDAAAGIAVI